MAVMNVHSFKVWHPEWGMPVAFKDKEFQFKDPISRTHARRIIQDIDGYAIAQEGKKRGPTVFTQRRSRRK